MLSDKGVTPDPEKIAAIVNLKVPEDKYGVRRFLGMATYVSKFIDGFSDITAPLRELLSGT